MKNIILSTALMLIFVGVNAQDNPNDKYAGTITQEDLKDYLSILASDALEGRETGTRGQKMAAAFIQNHFQEIGLAPGAKNEAMSTYLQPVPLEKSRPGETYVLVNGQKKNNFEDIVYYGSLNLPDEEKINVVFGGEGLDSDLENLDVDGKGVVVFSKAGFQAYSNMRKKVQENGAKALFIVSTDSIQAFKKMASQFKSFIGGGSLQLASKEVKDSSIGVFFTSGDLAAEMFGSKRAKLVKAIESKKAGKSNALKKIKEGSIAMKITRIVKQVKSENVLGYLEGSDKKDELIVITAHYDHIGRRGDDINNGADDDGSGTTAVMEIAQAFAQAKADGNGPRRSILFMTVTGEEKGLLGSQYYVENPVFELTNTMVNLNIDMIGRIDDAHKDQNEYVYLVGSDKLSQDLHDLSEAINKSTTNLALDYTYNDENHPDRIYYRSDHWNFAKNNIPVIFYFNGTHPDYHRPTDTIDKIAFDILEKRTKLVFYTAWELANRESKLSLNKQ